MSEAPLNKRDLAELGAETLAGLLLDYVGRDESLEKWAVGKLSGIGVETLAGTLLRELNDYETLKSRLRQILAESGVEELADALIESVGKDWFLKKEARKALAEVRENPEEVADEIRKEIESLHPEEMLEPWSELESLVGDVDDLIRKIETKVGKKAPDIAFDLLLSILHLAPGITDAIFRYSHMSDIDEDRGEELVETAYQAFLDQARSIAEDPTALADKLFDVLKHGANYSYANVVRDLADALGTPGIERLMERCDSFDEEHASEKELSESGLEQGRDRSEAESGGSRSAVDAIRKEVADLQGGIGAWLRTHAPH